MWNNFCLITDCIFITCIYHTHYVPFISVIIFHWWWACFHCQYTWLHCLQICNQHEWITTCCTHPQICWRLFIQNWSCPGDFFCLHRSGLHRVLVHQRDLVINCPVLVITHSFLLEVRHIYVLVVHAVCHQIWKYTQFINYYDKHITDRYRA